MPTARRTARDTWISEALRTLGVGGVDAVRIEKLAQALGVTKGGFYWHFQDRSALLDEMLDAWERLVVDEVIERVDADGGDPDERVRRLSKLASSSPELMSIELAVRDWARRDEGVAARLRGVDNRRMAYLRSLFGASPSGEDDVEARCLLFYSLWLGNHFIAADHAGRRRGDVVKAALRLLGAST